MGAQPMGGRVVVCPRFAPKQDGLTLPGSHFRGCWIPVGVSVSALLPIPHRERRRETRDPFHRSPGTPPASSPPASTAYCQGLLCGAAGRASAARPRAPWMARTAASCVSACCSTACCSASSTSRLAGEGGPGDRGGGRTQPGLERRKPFLRSIFFLENQCLMKTYSRPPCNHLAPHR